MATIGVTGHRILTDVERVEAGVDEALQRIEQKFPQQAFAVISSLAEGADRIVVRRVLARRGARLVVPLPLSRPDYATDFASVESKAEFAALVDGAAEVIELAAAGSRDEAYEAAGVYVLDHSDVLLAIWDGQDAQGVGGTGAIVAEARRRGMPVAWVHAGNRRPGTLEPTSLGAEQGRTTFERF